ncbi:hypothetical protein BH18VER1_BH18VER1_01700 [soil metagenome]
MIAPGTRPTLDLADQGSGQVGGTVRALERRWQNAIIKHDFSVIDDLVADDFIGTSSTGRVGTKSTLLDEIKRDENTYKSATARNMTVRTYGQNVAVVTGVASESGTTPDGQRFSTSRRFTDTWMQRNGRWQCTASHATQLSKR